MNRPARTAFAVLGLLVLMSPARAETPSPDRAESSPTVPSAPLPEPTPVTALQPAPMPTQPPLPKQPTPTPTTPPAAMPAMPLAASRPPSAPTGPARLSAATVPYMIGDSSGSSCGSLTLNGVAVISIAHPTFGCSRLNIAEQNNPIVANRIYVDYRHFENATLVDIFSTLPPPRGARDDLEIDRVNIGWEQMITPSTSIEFRLPINYQLTSDGKTNEFTCPTVVRNVFERRTAFGNMGLILKHVLLQNERLTLSTGLGLNLPTAPGIELVGNIDNRAFPVLTPDGRSLGPTFDLRQFFVNTRTNETVNLSPFLGYYWTPTDRLFGIGFAQVDIPLNESTIRVENGFSMINGVTTNVFSLNERISQQTLLRLNLGAGFWLLKGAGARRNVSLAASAELHYTTTLTDAEVTRPITILPDLGAGAASLVFGNTMNRSDLLNLAFGVPLIVGPLSVTNGLVVPLRDGENRGFDLEYNLRVQWNF